MRSLVILTIMAVVLAAVPMLRAQPPGADAPELLQVEQLMAERKFDQALAMLRATVEQKRETAPAVAALAQYRVGLYQDLVKKYSPQRGQWLPVIEAELRKVITEFPAQLEPVHLARVRLVSILLEQRRKAEALQEAQTLVGTTAEWPKYNALGRLRLAEMPLTLDESVVEGKDIHAAYLSAIGPLRQVIADTASAYPEVANEARLRLLYVLVFTWQFEAVPAVAEAVLADHAAGRASQEQAGWALWWQGRALIRQERFEEAIEPLQMAAALCDPNHLDVRYKALEELRRAYVGIVDREYQAAQCALADGNTRSARSHLEAAYTWVGPSGGYRSADVAGAVAKLAEQAGQTDAAIAWHRLLIRNPAKLDGDGQKAVETIARLFHESGRLLEEEQWWLYLLAPAEFGDPTAGIVARVVGSPPEQVTDPTVDSLSARHTALGKFYCRQRRFADAEATFRKALDAAATELERGEALFELVRATAMHSEDLYRAGRNGEAQSLLAQSRQYATEAVEAWLPVTLNGSRTNAHYANERALYGHARVGDYKQALATANRFLAELGPYAEVSKCAFAQYMRMQALAWNERYAEAAQAGTALQQQFGPYDKDGYVRTICEATLIRTADYLHQAGDPQAALATLDLVEEKYPDGFTGWIASVRENIVRSLEP